MKKLIFLLYFLVLACAAPIKDPREGSGIDPAFESYVLLFEDIYNTFIYDIPITFKDLPFPYIGKCRAWTNGFEEIFIDPEYWNLASEKEKTSLLFHELGHCLLFLNHDDQELDDGCASSLMNQYQLSNKCLEKHWIYYIDELYDKGLKTGIFR